VSAAIGEPRRSASAALRPTSASTRSFTSSIPFRRSAKSTRSGLRTLTKASSPSFWIRLRGRQIIRAVVRPSGIFADITGCISSEGYNILSARAYSESSEKSSISFTWSTTARPPPVRAAGGAHQEEMAAHRKRRGQRGIAHCRPTRCTLPKSNAARKRSRRSHRQQLSNNFTVLEIEAQDRFGLLFRMREA